MGNDQSSPLKPQKNFKIQSDQHDVSSSDDQRANAKSTGGEASSSSSSGNKNSTSNTARNSAAPSSLTTTASTTTGDINTELKVPANPATATATADASVSKPLGAAKTFATQSSSSSSNQPLSSLSSSKRPSKSSSRSSTALPPSESSSKLSRKVGKADWRRDSILFGGFLLVMGLLSYWSSQVGNAPDPKAPQKPKVPSLAELRKHHAVLTTEILQKQKSSLPQNRHGDIEPRLGDCPVFLSTSTLPQTGWGLMAGRSFNVGEEIPVVDSSSSSLLWMLVKPHPLLHNVQWNNAEDGDDPSTTPAKLVATQPIVAGQEFFVDPLQFESILLQNHRRLGATAVATGDDIHNHIHSSIPTTTHFDLADGLIRKFRYQFRLGTRTAGGAIKKTRVDDVGHALTMMIHAVQLYDPITARLLPKTVADLLLLYSGSAITTTTALHGLKNYTHSSVAVWGHCWTDVVVRRHVGGGVVDDDSGSGDNDNGTDDHQVLAKDFAREGERVMPVPLYVHDMMIRGEDINDNHSACPDDVMDDGTDDQSCPNSNTDQQKVSQQLPSSSCLPIQHLSVALCPLNGVMEVSSDPSVANVEYRFGTRNALGHAIDSTALILGDDADRETLLGKHRFSLLWEAVALHELDQGEKIVVNLGNLYQQVGLPDVATKED